MYLQDLVKASSVWSENRLWQELFFDALTTEMRRIHVSNDCAPKTKPRLFFVFCVLAVLLFRSSFQSI